jgi:hypothetical protein
LAIGDSRIAECGLSIGVVDWRFDCRLMVVDCITEWRFQSTLQSTISIGNQNRQSQSAIDNLNRQSTIGNESSIAKPNHPSSLGTPFNRQSPCVNRESVGNRFPYLVVT